MEVEETKGEEGREEGEVRVIEEASEEAGMPIPLAELGGSLAAEYKAAVMEDQSLEKWRVNADQSVNGFKWDQGLLKKLVEDVIRGNRKVMAVVGFRHRMLHLVHDQLGHVGTGKMLWALKRQCTWPGMSGNVKAYVKGCLECQRMRKGSARKIPMGEIPIHDSPFNNVAIDIVGPFPRAKGFKFLLTYTCLASRYPEAIPMKSATTAEECLMEIFSRNSIPRTILSDQGSQFMGILVKGLCKRLGINQIRTTPYHPECNGSVERFHGTLVPILRKVSSKYLPWPDQVKFALYAVSSTPNWWTGYAPFEIVHGRNLSGVGGN